MRELAFSNLAGLEGAGGTAGCSFLGHRRTSGTKISPITREWLMSTKLGIVLVAVAGLTACKPQPWIRSQIKPANMGFSLEMPWPASEKVKKITTVSGPVDLHLYQSDRGPLYVYTMAYEDFDMGSSDAKYYLGALTKTIVGTDQLISRREYLQNGYPAMEIRTSGQGNSLHIERLILANGKMFHLALQMPSSEKLSGEGQRFFDSFRIEPKQPAPAG
jgi:hypothetical protein